MAFVLEESETVEFEVIPAGSVLLTEIVNVEDKESPWDIDENDPSLGKKHQVSFRFKVTQPGPYYGRTLFGNTPTTFTTHPDCKLRAWVLEILGQNQLPVGFVLDLDVLVGLPVKVAIDHRKAKTNADGTPKPPQEFASDLLRAEGFEDAGDSF
jgi:hypothetical protein